MCRFRSKWSGVVISTLLLSNTDKVVAAVPMLIFAISPNVVEPVIDKINTKYWYSTADVKSNEAYRGACTRCSICIWFGIRTTEQSINLFLR